jgi:phosphatidylglycerol:prolipoprotein diacylglycerol transferase
MPLLSDLLAIEISIDPEIREFGGLLLTWHGVFTALGIAAGVFLAVVVARRLGFTDDDAYSGALIAIPCGIIGARALYVVERWNQEFSDSWVDIFRLNEGGISIYGAVLGGLLGITLYCVFRRLPILRALDAGAIGGALGLAIGRIGDVINGEHFAKASDLPWAVRYTHENSPSFTSHPDCSIGSAPGFNPSEICAQHPAVAYEMLGDLLILGVLLVMLRFVRHDGVILFTAMLLYSLMRFGLSYLRVDSREIILDLTTPQVTALILIPISVIGIIWCLMRKPRGEAGATARPVPAPVAGSTAS